MKTCFDANVLLEVLLPKRLKPDIASEAIRRAKMPSISPLSAHLYVHFGKKENFEVSELITIVGQYQILDFGDQQVRWAIAHCRNDDFEDALQVACAVMGGCDTFVTFDKQLAKAYSPFINMKVLS